ncbi:fascin domain-containing protein [Microtetraspora niveoalba]|uniref:fascin domain-containing protein n=1 Tax=Microtetraspora niveoalba TaxID=46175 RepID=UPI0012F78243|nr:hypothetical protein [Microtetraspora niveoalba]
MRKKIGALATTVIAVLSVASISPAARASAAGERVDRAGSEASAAVDCSWEYPRFRLRSRGTGKYVAIEYGYTGDRYAMLRARADYGQASVFVMCTHDGLWTGLWTIDGGFVAAEVNYTGANDGMLRARSAGVGSWEQFDVRCVVSNGPDLCNIRSRGTGLYVAAEVNYSGGDDGMLRARSSSVGSWEQFYAEGM